MNTGTGGPTNTGPSGGTNTNGQTNNGGSDNEFNTAIDLEEFDPIHDENCQKLQELLDMETDPSTSDPSTLKEVVGN